MLYEVSTDKVDSEVPSPMEGVITEIRVPEGETVDVGTVLAIVELAEGAEAPAPDAALPVPSAVAAPPAAVSAADSVGASGAGSSVATIPAAAMTAPTAPASAGLSAVSAAASTPAADATSAAAASGASRDGADASGGGRLLSPVVRRLVREHGLDPEALVGTGVGGPHHPVRCAERHRRAPARRR